MVGCESVLWWMDNGEFDEVVVAAYKVGNEGTVLTRGRAFGFG